MAVTQQLARLTDEQIALCATEVETLERVCWWEELPENDYADLDWSPYLLGRAAARAGIATHLSEALALSTTGRRELHPGYDGLSAIYAPLTCLSAAETADVAARLTEIDVAALLSPEVVEDAAADTRITNPREYLIEMFERLRRFYSGAADRGMGMVLWWDRSNQSIARLAAVPRFSRS